MDEKTAPAAGILTYKEVAARIGVSVRTVFRLVEGGHLRRYRLPGRVRAFGVSARVLGRFLSKS
jgi:excisionase family DNA binding protein